MQNTQPHLEKLNKNKEIQSAHAPKQTKNAQPNLSSDLLEAGFGLLNENKIPNSEILNRISATKTGMNMMMVGLAAKELSKVGLTLDAISKLEQNLYDDETLSCLNDWQKLELLREAKDTAKFRTSLARTSYNDADFVSLQAEILKHQTGNQKSKKISTNKAESKVVTQELKATITKSYQIVPWEDRQ